MPTADIDFAAILPRLVKAMLGDPTSETATELRFGTNGSLSVKLPDGTWYDFEANEGGGTLDFVARETGLSDRAAQIGWLEREGWLNGEIKPKGKANSNGAAHPQPKPKGKFVKAYPYYDEDGWLLFEVCRMEPKTFLQRRKPRGDDPPDTIKNGWVWSTKNVQPVPYGLPALLEVGDRVVFIPEGEKDCELLWRWLIPATTNAGGAGKWHDDLTPIFKGCDVVIVPDNDKAGRDHAQDVAAKLSKVAKRVRILELWKSWPEMPEKGDISDWVENARATTLEYKIPDALYALADAVPNWKPAAEQPTTNKPTLILSSAQFVEGFVPPDYVIFGLLQRRFLYSITGRTGAGKTAILLRIAAHIAETMKIIDREVEQGRVLYLAGENADDVRMRWIALAQHMGFDLDTVSVNFIPGTFKISEMRDRIRAEIEQIGPVSLIIVDTAAAYFEGNDENSNTQFGDYARHTLRPLVTMPGAPCVVVACHPVKNAADDNLIPRGGGAFLNEVDGNLTAVITSGVVELHWQGKYRGPDFAPIHFTTRTVTHERLKDSKGRLIPTVVAYPLSEQGREDMARAQRSNEDALLILLLDPACRNATQRELATRLGWLMKDGKPHQVKAGRTLATLKKAKLVTVERDQIALTKKGREVAESLV